MTPPKLTIKEISEEKAKIILEDIYSEEAKAHAFYMEFTPPYEDNEF